MKRAVEKKDTQLVRVRILLEEIPETRNSDTTLMIEYWKKHFRESLEPFGVTFENLHLLPDQGTLKRFRAKIQNEEHLYLPTDSKVRKLRKISEENWANWCNSTKYN